MKEFLEKAVFQNHPLRILQDFLVPENQLTVCNKKEL